MTDIAIRRTSKFGVSREISIYNRKPDRMRPATR